MQDNKKIDKLNKNLDKINYILSKNNIEELLEILGNNKKILLRNLMAGVSKGIGIGVGVSVISAIIIIILQRIVKLNIPIIGDYVADIIQIVQNSR